jgi:hypothetical protein
MLSQLEGAGTEGQNAWNFARWACVEVFVPLSAKDFSMNLKMVLSLASVVMLLLVGGPAQARSKAQSGALFAKIQSLDTQLFDAYNHCDLKTLGAMVSNDLEFYHDQTGLSTGKEPFLAAIKQNICGKVERTLVPGSLEVYPLKGYGAVEIGAHRFHQAGQPEDRGGEAKFVTLWQNKDGAWKVTRAISYDHEAVAK